MSNRNAPNGFGGYMSGFGFGNFGGASEPEPPQARDRAHGQAAGAAAANRNATQHPKEKPNGNTAANAASAANANRNPPEQPVILGLAELVEVLNAMAAAPLGARPKINPELIDRIKNSPLHPVIGGLQPVYKKLGPVEGSPEHQQALAQAEAAQRAEAQPSPSQPGSAPGPGPSSVQQEPPQLAPTPASDPSSVHQPPPTPAALDVAITSDTRALEGLTMNLQVIIRCKSCTWLTRV